MRFRGLLLAVSACAMTLGGSLALAAPVLAAAPETPESGKASAITATSATLEGVLNPKAVAPVEGGEYVFLYNSSVTECEGAFAAPEPAGIAAGLPKEPVVAKLEGLQPSMTYTFCLEEKNTTGEIAKGLPVSFTTKPAPPQIVSESAFSVKPSEATLGAAINPNNQETTYTFQYATKATGEVLEGAITTLNGPSPLSGFGEQGVGVPTGAVLTHGTTYYYRVIAKNTKSEETIGKVEHFTTPITPETPENLEGEPAGTGVKLKGILNPKEKGDPGTYEFLYKQSEQSTTECTGGQTTPPQTATGATPETVKGEVTGLLPNTTYTFCLRAHNEAGEESPLSTPITLTTLAVAPSVGGESFTNVGSSSATLHAQVFPGGAPTTYFFEYGPTTAYGSTTPLQSAGASATPVSVLAHIEQLQPGTPYHFRIVLNNTHGEAKGEDTTFSTLPLATQGLPDGRGYELVSPLNNGHVTVVPGRPGVRAATDGNKVTYLSTTPPTGGIGHGEPPPAENGSTNIETNSGDNQYLAERSSGGGWTAANIQPADVNTASYQSFSSDLSEAIVQSAEPLSENTPGSEYAGLYLRSTASDGYQSLFRRTPSHVISPEQFEVSYAGASSGGSHQLFEANDALLEGVGPAAEELNMFASEKAVRPLYDSTGERLLAVNVLPNGRVAPEASYGSPKVASGSQSGFHHLRLDHVISTDGSRIFWTDTSTEVTPEDPVGVARLFVRENDASPSASTVQIDASQAPVGSGALEGKERAKMSGAGVFMTASSNGSKVYFTDDHKLTTDSVAAPNEPDLYMYDFEAPVGQRLTDLTTGVQNAGEHAHVMGVLGASEDGSYVYFAATGALAPGAKPQECIEETRTTLCNVYALHLGEAPNLVATVTYFDGEGGVANAGEAAIVGHKESEEKVSGDWVRAVGDRLAEVSPDGRHLVFESIVDLLGFDGRGSREIYLYDFGSGLSCVSCNPVGVPSLSSERYAMHFELPESFSSTYALRGLSADGDRVFFNSKEALVGNDENNRTDVYEWERDGAGSCVRMRGCLFLLSGGTSSEYSALLDASASGDDVFIESRAHLVPQVHDEVYEVYDARVGAPPAPAPLVCSGSGCQGVPGAPPIFATPSSVTASGVGNFPSLPPPLIKQVTIAEKLAKALRVCKKERARKKRAICEKSAHRRYDTKVKPKGKRARVYGKAK